MLIVWFFILSFQIVTMTAYNTSMANAGHQALARPNANATMVKSAVH